MFLLPYAKKFKKEIKKISVISNQSCVNCYSSNISCKYKIYKIVKLNTSMFLFKNVNFIHFLILIALII